MNRSSYLVFAIILFIEGCADNSFKKSPDGAEYRIITISNGKKAVAGNFLQLNRIIKYKDSVLANSIESSTPMFTPYDTSRLPPFFRNIHEGDSLILRISTDTLIKMGQAAPFM